MPIRTRAGAPATHWLHIRLTAEEREVFVRYAEARGASSTSDCARLLIIGEAMDFVEEDVCECGNVYHGS
jgi:hypothetical protein